MAKYYCILFDADNTLLNFDAAESKALAETLVNYGIEPDAETVQTYRTINEELWRQLEKGQIRREKLLNERFSRFLKAIDAAGDGHHFPCGNGTSHSVKRINVNAVFINMA